MTTPGQAPPDGAYVIDQGGGEYNYGQGHTDKSAANLMVASFPSISLLDPIGAVFSAISVVSDTLLSLPLEVLQLFEQLIPGDLGDAFETVSGAVGAIVDQLSAIGPMFGSVAFSAVTAGLDLLTASVQQVLDIFNGLVVTPISGAVQGVLDWWTAINGQIVAVQNTTGSLIDALISGLAGGASTGGDPLGVLVGLLNQGLQIPANFLSMFAQLFGQQAVTQAQLDALQNGGFAHDFASNSITGWNNLVGTLALSARGSFIQSTTETVSYRASGVALDKYGVTAYVNPSMRGVCRIGICSTTTGSSGADLEIYRGFDGDAIRIVTRSSPTLTVVQKQFDLIGTNRLNGPTSFDLRTDGVNKFSVRQGGQPVPALDWTDTGGLVTHGASNRNILLTSNGLNRNEDSFYGPAITKVVGYAW